nr:hypothetical protein [Tanacetum cinerariifolium]
VNGNEGLKVMINKPYLSRVNDEGVPTCFQCGKSFPSMKSLFGHMRCHPDRFWHGVIPPPNAVLAQGNPGGDGGHVVDLNKYLKGWSVTERRGRRLLKIDDSDEDLLGAVEDLMSLANSNAISPPSIDKGKAVVMQVEDYESKEALGGYRSSHNKADKKIISDDHFVGENVAKEAEFAGDVISISNSTKPVKRLVLRWKVVE